MREDRRKTSQDKENRKRKRMKISKENCSESPDSDTGTDRKRGQWFQSEVLEKSLQRSTKETRRMGVTHLVSKK